MEINGADTAWMMVSCALVLLMTPGLALFYGGMVKSRNVLSTFMHSFAALGVMTLQWVLIGYSLSFGNHLDPIGFVGGFEYVGLAGMFTTGKDGGLDFVMEGSIPKVLFMAFQMMFAIITPALVSGAFAERLKFSSFLVFTLLWSTLVYDPVCHWVWGGGLLAAPSADNAVNGLVARTFGTEGGLDFAGGTVVHMTSGISALVFAIMLGKRKYPTPPHNLTMTLLGAGILWFGWFGFNAGSALAANGIAALALVNTHVAAGAGACAWVITEWAYSGKPTALGAASGLVAGLVCITPAAGFVMPTSAILLGLIAGPVCYFAVLLKAKAGYDDALDAFGVHGVGGTLGAILTGVFAVAAFTGKQKGLLEGGGHLLLDQVAAVVLTAVYSIAVTFALLKIIDMTLGLRVSDEEEREGLDTSLHGEQGYVFSHGGAGAFVHGAAEPVVDDD